MTDRVVIEGGVVRHERIETVSQAPLEALAPHLVKPIATILPVLPANPVRYIAFDGETNRGLMLVEKAPGLRHIRVAHEGAHYTDDYQRRDAAGDAGQAGTWRVQFPWSYFAFPFRVSVQGAGVLHDFVIDNTLLYWSREQFRTTQQQLLPARAPNVDEDGRICWGYTRAVNTSLSERVDDYINNFSTTTFNEHLGHVTPFGTSLTEWETQSPADNPLAWRDWPIWEQQAGRFITVDQIPHETPATPLEAAQLDPTYIELPPVPQNFTIARAREYLLGLAEPARQRLILAVQAFTEEQTAPAEEATA